MTHEELERAVLEELGAVRSKLSEVYGEKRYGDARTSRRFTLTRRFKLNVDPKWGLLALWDMEDQSEEGTRLLDKQAPSRSDVGYRALEAFTRSPRAALRVIRRMHAAIDWLDRVAEARKREWERVLSQQSGATRAIRAELTLGAMSKIGKPKVKPPPF